MIHPHTAPRRISAEVGLGVFATDRIPRGTIVWALDPFDLKLTPEVIAGYPPMLQAAVARGAYPADDGRWVFCWDHGRHVNHSCRPNCVDIGGSFQLALRTIEPGDELTCDYAACGHFTEFMCGCGAPDCRGWIPLQSERATPEPETLAELFAVAGTLDQPLLAFAAPEPAEAWVLELFGAKASFGRVGGQR